MIYIYMSGHAFWKCIWVLNQSNCAKREHATCERWKNFPGPLNTSAQIQQIFSEIQSQLPSVNFDNDDQNDDADGDNEDV